MADEPGNTGNPGEQHVSPFDAIRHTTDSSNDFWSARELGQLLGYSGWRNFTPVIERAKDICFLLQLDVSRHLAAESKSVALGSGAERAILDYHLSQFAVYLALLCSDVKKPEVIYALAYVAGALLNAETDPNAAIWPAHIPDLDMIAITREQKTIGQIVRAFHHLRSERHYRVGPYAVDLYFPDFRIVVECDENGHSNRTNYSLPAELARQAYIERALECQFVRYNPDAPDFNIGDVINRIMLLVYRCAEQPCDEQPGESEAS